MSETKAVYKAISAVQAELATIGIGKGQRNDYDKYNFRGIDDVYNVLAGILAKNELCILPRVMGRECVERTSNKGTPLFHVTLEVEYDFVSAKDGSQHILKAFGEALDRSDKATPKAMSAAYKYLCFEAFCIPVDVEDADSQTHEVATFTQAQYTMFHQLLGKADRETALDFVIFMASLDEPIQMDLQNSFEKGNIPAGKEAARHLEALGYSVVEEIESELNALAEKGDEQGLFQIFDENTREQNMFIWRRGNLNEAAKSMIQNRKEAA